VNRRALGRGRLLVGLGALLILAGSVPAWWTVGGTVAPATSGNAFAGTGIVVFISAIGGLALLVLPFASRTGESALDRPASYLVLVLMGGSAFLVRAYEIATSPDFGGLSLPDRALGLWLTAIGLAVFAWGVGELIAERPPGS
jgi:hypothetical protein